jgi:hypothetical protein
MIASGLALFCEMVTTFGRWSSANKAGNDVRFAADEQEAERLVPLRSDADGTSAADDSFVSLEGSCLPTKFWALHVIVGADGVNG